LGLETLEQRRPTANSQPLFENDVALGATNPNLVFKLISDGQKVMVKKCSVSKILAAEFMFSI
jgi:hypothetical protein